MTKPIQVPATLAGVSTLKDGGVTVRFSTQELNSDDKTMLFNKLDQFGWLCFKETEFKDNDLKELENIRRDTGGKSPSQRLRSVLFILYQHSGELGITFEQYYSHQMEKVIDNIKRRLDS